VWDLAKTPPFSVHWENTCHGSWVNLPIAYEVNFIVSMPKGTDLGEEVVDFDPSAIVPSVCNPGDIPVVAATSPPPTAGASGWQGRVLACNPSHVDAQATLQLSASLAPCSTSLPGKCTMNESMTVTVKGNSGSVGSDTPYKTADTYQAGTWKIASVKLNGANLPTAIPQESLPSLGGPTFDFRGGLCALP
jgi:hypothetical protein